MLRENRDKHWKYIVLGWQTSTSLPGKITLLASSLHLFLIISLKDIFTAHFSKAGPFRSRLGKSYSFFFHTEISSQTTPPYNNCTSTLNSLILKHYYSFHTHLHISITSCISSRVREATLLDHKESILLDQKEFVQDSPKIVIYLLYHYNQYSKTKTYNGVSWILVSVIVNIWLASSSVTSENRMINLCQTGVLGLDNMRGYVGRLL